MIFPKVHCGSLLALAVLGAVLPQPGWAHGSPTVTQEKLAEDYRINPGDVVSIIVINHPEFSLNGQVLPDGTFVFPILGKIKAAGRTRDEIASEIAKGLKDKKQLVRPNVTVNVVQQEPREITILGAVRGAGKLVLKENTSSWLSILISPNSLTNTATLRFCRSVKIWFNSVVLPLPKNPVIIVTGIPRLGTSTVAAAGSVIVLII